MPPVFHAAQRPEQLEQALRLHRTFLYELMQSGLKQINNLPLVMWVFKNVHVLVPFPDRDQAFYSLNLVDPDLGYARRTFASAEEARTAIRLLADGSHSARAELDVLMQLKSWPTDYGRHLPLPK